VNCVPGRSEIWSEKTIKAPPGLAAYEFAMMTFINTHSKGLTILPRYRLVRNLDGFAFERFRKSVVPYFDWYSYPFADADERAASYAEFRRDFEGSNHGRRGIGVYSGVANRGANAFYLFLLQRDAEIAVYGHIHRPYIHRLPKMTVANTGSVSQSYDGDRRASYLVIDGESITIRRVEYDVESEVEELLHSGLPHADWMSRILLAGEYCSPKNGRW
jgi:diadenosine tetraphosphatase ApaH/serine/threonine PP2A family protein phosphatase